MILVLHVLTALASLLFSAYVFFRPSDAKVKASCGLIGAVMATGTLLIFTTQASILRACVMGLAFVFVTTALTVLANKKLSSQEIK